MSKSDYTVEQQEQMNKQITMCIFSAFELVIEKADEIGMDRETAIQNYISGCIQVYEQLKPFDDFNGFDKYKAIVFSK